MNILFYSTVTDQIGERLLRMVHEEVSGERLEYFQNMAALQRGLSQTAAMPAIAVLCPADRENLAELVALHELIRDTHIILVLPDRDEETIALGHKLRPRFLSFTNSDLQDVAAVFAKIFDNDRRKKYLH